MDELTTDEHAVQKAENTSEDSQLIANVVAVVNDDLVNKVVERLAKHQPMKNKLYQPRF